MADNFRFWFVYLLIVTTIVFIGWGQPLRYRFLSPQEIALEELVTPAPSDKRLIVTAETPQPPTAAAPTPNWMWDPHRKTPLDREPYNYRQSSSSYSRGTTSGLQPSQ